MLTFHCSLYFEVIPLEADAPIIDGSFCTLTQVSTVFPQYRLRCVTSVEDLEPYTGYDEDFDGDQLIRSSRSLLRRRRPRSQVKRQSVSYNSTTTDVLVGVPAASCPVCTQSHRCLGCVSEALRGPCNATAFPCSVPECLECLASVLSAPSFVHPSCAANAQACALSNCAHRQLCGTQCGLGVAPAACPSPVNPRSCQSRHTHRSIRLRTA